MTTREVLRALPPPLRRVFYGWALVLVFALTGVLTSLLARNWIAAFWAGACVVSALATLLAVRQWLTWRSVAEHARHTTTIGLN